MKRQISTWHVIAGVVLILIGVVTPTKAQNTVTFDNQSGEPALVKLIGPTSKEVEVPSGTKQSVEALAGRYTIKVRYGTQGKYRYSKGQDFEVEQTATTRSEITITLHKVMAGNYDTQPISEKEFGETKLSRPTERRAPPNDTAKSVAPNDLPWGIRLPTGWSLLKHKRYGKRGHEMALKAPVKPPPGATKAGHAIIYLGSERIRECPRIAGCEDDRSCAFYDAIRLAIATQLDMPKETVSIEGGVKGMRFFEDNNTKKVIAAQLRQRVMSTIAIFKEKAVAGGVEPVVFALCCPNDQFDVTMQALREIVDKATPEPTADASSNVSPPTVTAPTIVRTSGAELDRRYMKSGVRNKTEHISIKGLNTTRQEIKTLPGGQVQVVEGKDVFAGPGTRDVHIEMEPGVMKTIYYGLTFTVACVASIREDGTLVVDKEGIVAKDEKGKLWESRKARIDDEEIIVFLPKESATSPKPPRTPDVLREHSR